MFSAFYSDRYIRIHHSSNSTAGKVVEDRVGDFVDNMTWGKWGNLISFHLRVLILLFCSSALYSGEKVEGVVTFFPLHPVSTSYTWEMRSTVSKVDFISANKAPPQYPWSGGFSKRVLLNVQLGIDLPLIGGESGPWIWYAGFPLSFNMVDDFFEPNTAPLINTDYWFGTRIEALYRIQESWPRNIFIKVLPFFHESTHIGDEFVLHMIDGNPTNFYRINVSYEAWEIVIGLDEWEKGNGNAFNLRFGMSGRWNKDGYYNRPSSSEIGSSLLPTDIIPSRGNMEFSGQINAVIEKGFPAIGSWVFQGGAEIENRILFDFFSSDEERHIWSVRSSIGWYRYMDNAYSRRLGIYFKLLAGQNPQGQLREQAGYYDFGIGLTLGL